MNGRGGHSFASRSDRRAGLRDRSRPEAARDSKALPDAHHRAGRRRCCTACARSLRHAIAFRMSTGRVSESTSKVRFFRSCEGYRGAHPPSAMRDPSWALFEEFQQAAGGRIVIITLAPERAGAIEFIRRATAAGIVVALGHTAASGSVIREAARAGARLSTHLGNGIASMLPRHPNPIWEQAALESLSASFIADGHHLDLATLRVLATGQRAGADDSGQRCQPAGGLAAGPIWRVGGRAIRPGRRRRHPYLAGSNHGLETGIGNLLAATGWTIEQALATVTTNPARLLGRPAPDLREGEPGRPGRLSTARAGRICALERVD